MSAEIYPPIPYEVASRLFRLEGGTLFWVDPPKNHPRMMGKEAGSIRKTHSNKSYVRVKINGLAYLRSRIVFLLANGRWPANQVDHINGNSLDDNPLNLREATNEQNAWNHKGRSKITGLPFGVSFNRGKFRARITKSKVKIFIGNFSTAGEAHAAYISARKEHFGEYA